MNVVPLRSAAPTFQSLLLIKACANSDEDGAGGEMFVAWHLVCRNCRKWNLKTSHPKPFIISLDFYYCFFNGSLNLYRPFIAVAKNSDLFSFQMGFCFISAVRGSLDFIGCLCVYVAVVHTCPTLFAIFSCIDSQKVFYISLFFYGFSPGFDEENMQWKSAEENLEINVSRDFS